MVRSIRECASHALLRTGTELSFEQRNLERDIAAESSEAPGYAGAQQAVWLAGKVGEAMLWLGWRLQPRVLRPR
jgi:hypothetical protein